MNIRPARIDDAAAIAHVLIAAWRQAYSGLLPEQYLNALNAAEKTQHWQTQLGINGPGRYRVVEVQGKVAGFSVFGPARDSDLQNSRAGELVALNIDPAYWGQGLGSALIRHSIDDAREQQWQALYLWVIRQNRRARCLYEHHGFQQEGRQKCTDTLTGHPLTEERYLLALAG